MWYNWETDYMKGRKMKKIIVLGSFSSEKYAAQAYNLAAKKYYGEFAFLNKIA